MLCFETTGRDGPGENIVVPDVLLYMITDHAQCIFEKNLIPNLTVFTSSHMHMLDPDGNEDPDGVEHFFQAIIRLGGIVQIVKCLP